MEKLKHSGASGSSKRSTFKDGRWLHTSRTLYVTNVPPSTSTSLLEYLFKDLDGFVAFRRVRSMCFVDFQSKQQFIFKVQAPAYLILTASLQFLQNYVLEQHDEATAAIWRTNSHKFSPNDEGILVSYDKDDNEERGGWSVRKREDEKRKRKETDATRIHYHCSGCSHFCLKLAVPLTELPARKTDGSRVVDMAKDLVHLMCAKGGVKLLKREKGTEKQFRYNCELCDLCVGYRPVSYEQETKFMYVLPEALIRRDAEEPQTAANKQIDSVGDGAEKVEPKDDPVLPS